VRVPAETWDRCWSVYIWYHGIFGTPNYPEGFVPFERPAWTGSVEIVLARDGEPGMSIYAPDSMYMEILFPLHSINVEDAEVRSAFYYDTTSTSWEVRFPDELDEAMLTVKTSDWRLRWSWGRINLGDIDYDRYMAPVLEEQLGSETYQQVESTLDSLRYAVGPLTLDCVGLLFAREFFAAARDESYQTIQQLQSAIRCGVCDATTPEFYSDLKKYLRLNVLSIMADWFFDMFNNLLLKLVGVSVALKLDILMMKIDCDYACFVRSMTWPFYMNMAIHYASQGVVELIHEFVEAGYMNCPLITDPEPFPPEVPALQPIGSPSWYTGGTDS